MLRPLIAQAWKLLDDLKETLQRKNEAYGNSVEEPLRIFSKASPVEQLKVRIDDKLSRIARGRPDDQEDTLLDLSGYITLLRAMLGRSPESVAQQKPDLRIVRSDEERGEDEEDAMAQLSAWQRAQYQSVEENVKKRAVH